MKKAITRPVITLAFLAALMGVSSVPLSASAQSGNNNWNHNDNNRWDNNRWDNNNRRDNNNNRWNNDNHNWRRVSDWESRNIAQRHFPRNNIVRYENRWNNDGHMERRYHFDDNHCVDVRDDGVVIRIIILVS